MKDASKGQASAWASRALDRATTPLVDAVADQVIKRLGLHSRLAPDGTPARDPLSMALKELAALRWNTKLMGLALAERFYAEGKAGPGATLPGTATRVGLTSKLCTQADIESDWLRFWCGQLQIVPFYSRKIWEYGFVLQALWEGGQLRSGAQGLGFAVGTELTPSYLAGRHIQVLATDLAGEDGRADNWAQTDQHAASLEGLLRPNLVRRERFLANCRFRPVDMNAIPEELHGQFDFCWSMCSFEHVGSIEQGLEFVRNSVRCLKPGGIAVHTTEMNLETEGETVDNWPTVLFQPRHFAELSRRLAADGHELLALDTDAGTGLLDRFIDVPPYDLQPHPALAFPTAPHLRLTVDGFPVTSVGLIVRAGG